jgi:crossover junction endodeoxyribonuclease RuvC
VITLGLDLSLTGSGWARLDTDRSRLTAGTVETKPGPALPRFRQIMDELPWAADLACVEQPSYASAGGQSHERAGLWWMVVDRLDRAGIPTAIVPPKTLKLFATGAGTASKTQMSDHLRKRLRDLCPDVEDDNQVDACWLALACAQRLGEPFLVLPVGQVKALDKVAWPELLSDDEPAPGPVDAEGAVA